MVPIFAMSFYTIYVVALKIMQFRSSKALETAFIAEAITEMKIDNWKNAEQKLEKQTSPVAAVMLKALKLVRYKDLPKSRVEPEIERVGTAELNNLKTNLRALEVIAAIAPLLGLLGTVMGMVKAFGKLAENTNRVDPSILAGGIWEALITTVAGLLVAIPAFAAYYYFSGQVDKVRVLMKDATTQILNLEKEEQPQIVVHASPAQATPTEQSFGQMPAETKPAEGSF